MKKTICCVGSTGFIGSEIYSELKKYNKYKLYRFSTKKNRYIDKCNEQYFDFSIFSSGIHPNSYNDNPNIYFKNKEIFRKTKKIFEKSNFIIFISSFKTLINENNRFISSNNKYNFYKHDTHYGKSKIILEKIFIKFCNKYNKRFIIICPSHVIGPNDKNFSPNGNFLNKIIHKKIIIIPDVNISITDNRNLSYFIVSILGKKKFLNKKILISDISIRMREYVKLIKKGKFYILINLSFFWVKQIYDFFNFLKKLKIIKKNVISDNMYNYIKLNPVVYEKYNFQRYSFKSTVRDTVDYFRSMNS